MFPVITLGALIAVMLASQQEQPVPTPKAQSITISMPGGQHPYLHVSPCTFYSAGLPYGVVSEAKQDEACVARETARMILQTQQYNKDTINIWVWTEQ